MDATQGILGHSALASARAGGRISGVYVYCYVHAAGEPSVWLRKLTTGSDALRTSVEVSLRGMRTHAISNSEELKVGVARSVGSGYILPVSWRVAGLITALDGDLRLQSIPNGWTQLSLRAAYSPSGNGSGRDHHLTVETVVKRLLDVFTAI